MTKEEATLRALSKEFAWYFDFDLPRWVIEGHIHAALESLVYGLEKSQELATSGSIIGEQSFEYPMPEAQ